MESWTVGLVILAFRQSVFDAMQKNSTRWGMLSLVASAAGVGLGVRIRSCV
jgi:hypothetical protein